MNSETKKSVTKKVDEAFDAELTMDEMASISGGEGPPPPPPSSTAHPAAAEALG